MSETPESLLNLVNASGFLFQLRVEEEVIQTQPKHKWEVQAREHRWSISDSGDEGYIDIILTAGNTSMVVECKRVREASWVFLIPHKRQVGTSHAKLCWWDRRPDVRDLFDYSEFTVMPSSPESAFCIVRGQSDKDKPMLERVSGNLLKSLEALANEELELTVSQHSKHRIYIPAIVTTAKLEVFHFIPDEVDIESGEFSIEKLADDQFKTVPLVRFRKNFTTTLATQNDKNRSIEDINRENERTVFIINATEFSTILREWEIRLAHHQWPWDMIERNQ
jgi:hypothetical protein